jgi:serine/threonine protein kinase
MFVIGSPSRFNASDPRSSRCRPTNGHLTSFQHNSSLDHAHAERVLHRDIQPANVLLARKGGKLVPRIADFGIARPMSEDDAQVEQSRVVGTPAFMPPEQLCSRTL